MHLKIEDIHCKTICYELFEFAYKYLLAKKKSKIKAMDTHLYFGPITLLL